MPNTTSKAKPETIKTRSGRTIIMNTPEEEAAIQRGIAADPDTFEVSTEDIKRMRRRGTQKAPTKESVTVRWSPEVLAAFRASGPGWQARMDLALRDWLTTHKPEELAA